jgi:hypothetical protein
MGKSKGPRNQNRNKIAAPKNEPSLHAAIHAPLQPPIKPTAARNAVRHIWGAIEKLAVVLSFVGVAYLVYDSLYQTNVTMSFVYSDAGSGLDNPVAIQNRSNLFSVKNIRWTCQIHRAEFERNNVIGDASFEFPTISVIEPGRIVNVACNSKRQGPTIITFGTSKLLSANIVMHLSYDAEIFGIFSLHRQVSTPFTWIGNIGQPQWVQGDFAK